MKPDEKITQALHNILMIKLAHTLGVMSSRNALQAFVMQTISTTFIHSGVYYLEKWFTCYDNSNLQVVEKYACIVWTWIFGHLFYMSWKYKSTVLFLFLAWYSLRGFRLKNTRNIPIGFGRKKDRQNSVATTALLLLCQSICKSSNAGLWTASWTG